MDKAIEILLKSVKGSTETLQYIAENTTGTNGMLLNSVIDTLKAQTLLIKNKKTGSIYFATCFLL